MRILKTLTLVLFIHPLLYAQVYAQSEKTVLKSIEINKARVPVEASLVLEHLKQSLFEAPKRRSLYNTLLNLNQNLSSVEDLSCLFFIKSEFYKYFLDNPELRVIETFQISSSHILSIQDKLKKNKQLYSELSAFIIEKTIEDFSPYIKDDFLNNYLALQESKDFLKVQKLKKVLKYLGGWVKIIETSSPEKLDLFLNKLSLGFLENIRLKSEYFKKSARDNISYTSFLGLDADKINAELDSKEILAPKPQSTDQFVEELDPKDLDETQSEQTSEKIDELIEKIEPEAQIQP